VRFDEWGNLTNGTLADYLIPQASSIPAVKAEFLEDGGSDAYDSGTGSMAHLCAAAAVQNAVVDALSHIGVRHIDRPCTPERVWRAIEKARIA
jgi:carbon-monoxide dehydrogenase large subunit